ncbi:MAG TPA: nucleotidyltransferase family protein [bacterium]|nr:nucleotidyltransferase family protein [bacterium]HPN31867.1 nucleotidyltransferase family protein [bacterium]
MNKNTIIDFLKTHKKEMQDTFGVNNIGLEGSYARNEATVESDIDILVEITSNNKFRSFFGLSHYLQKNLQKKIDLGIESALKPIVKKNILEDIIYV